MHSELKLTFKSHNCAVLLQTTNPQTLFLTLIYEKWYVTLPMSKNTPITDLFLSVPAQKQKKVHQRKPSSTIAYLSRKESFQYATKVFPLNVGHSMWDRERGSVFSVSSLGTGCELKYRLFTHSERVTATLTILHLPRVHTAHERQARINRRQLLTAEPRNMTGVMFTYWGLRLFVLRNLCT